MNFKLQENNRSEILKITSYFVANFFGFSIACMSLIVLKFGFDQVFLVERNLPFFATYVLTSIVIYFVLHKLKTSHYEKFLDFERELALRDQMIQKQLQDISRAKEAHAIAERAQMLAHDVRTPFTLVQTLLDMISEAKSAEQVNMILKTSVPDIASSLSSVNGMIEDLMEAGNVNRGLMTESVSFSTVLDKSLRNLLRFKEDVDLKIEQNIKLRHKVSIHSKKMSRVFINIIDNAIEHMDGAGTLWFNAEEKGSQVEISFGNSTTYIPKEDRDRLFEAFFTKGKSAGTGLGLTIAKKVIEAHGGSIWCQSSREKGTEFCFTLPISSEADDSPMTLLSSSQEYFQAAKVCVGFEDSKTAIVLPLEATQKEQAREGRIIRLAQDRLRGGVGRRPRKQSSSGCKVREKIILVEDNPTMAVSWKVLYGDPKTLKIYRKFADFQAEAVRPGFFDDVRVVVTDFYLDQAKTGIDVSKLVKDARQDLPTYLFSADASLADPLFFDGLLPKSPKEAIQMK